MLAIALLSAALAANADTEAPAVELARAVSAATRVELLSIDPGWTFRRREEVACRGWCFHDVAVVGATRVDAAAEVATIRDELVRWIEAPETDTLMMCFDPRHGVRVEHDGHVYDFVVCFECSATHVYKDMQPGAFAALYHAGRQQPWDALLTAHGVPLAPAE